MALKLHPLNSPSPMTRFKSLYGIAVLFAACFNSGLAAPLFAPGNPIFGGRINGSNFEVGAIGLDGGNTNYTDNFWPAAESPDHAIDGFGQKYLNFAELNTGFIVTP